MTHSSLPICSYPDATPEDLQASEEMVTGAKKLPCNHIFHSRLLSLFSLPPAYVFFVYINTFGPMRTLHLNVDGNVQLFGLGGNGCGCFTCWLTLADLIMVSVNSRGEV